MKDEILYMLGVVSVGFLVNYALRALPFLIFAGKGRELPRWVERLGAFISPVIIACLIVYSYSGLGWKTLWPYLAGAITVALQIWKRNPLASIVAGTVLYMWLLNCGCVSHKTVSFDAQHPAVRYATTGIYFGDERVEPQEVAEILADYDVPRDRAIHIRLDPDVKDLRGARFLMACIAKGGYTRTVLVTKQHAESVNVGKKKPKPSAPSTPKPPAKIRYKKSAP